MSTGLVDTAVRVQRLIAKHGQGAEHVYLGGARDLEVQRVADSFIVEEYDGSESLLLRDKAEWI